MQSLFNPLGLYLKSAEICPEIQHMFFYGASAKYKQMLWIIYPALVVKIKSFSIISFDKCPK